MPLCETCQKNFAGEGRFCSAECHPGFGKGRKHPGSPRFPGRRAAAAAGGRGAEAPEGTGRRPARSFTAFAIVQDPDTLRRLPDRVRSTQRSGANRLRTRSAAPQPVQTRLPRATATTGLT